MTFGATPDVLAAFNFYEATFWLLVGSTLLLLTTSVPKQLCRWLQFTGCNIFVFGITDVVELYTGGFLHTAQWLFVWKALHVLGLIISVVWYVRVRRGS